MSSTPAWRREVGVERARSGPLGETVHTVDREVGVPSVPVAGGSIPSIPTPSRTLPTRPSGRGASRTGPTGRTTAPPRFRPGGPALPPRRHAGHWSVHSPRRGTRSGNRAPCSGPRRCASQPVPASRRVPHCRRVLGDGKHQPAGLCRLLTPTSVSIAAGDNGTLCSLPPFIRSSGMRHSAAWRFISLHWAPPCLTRSNGSQYREPKAGLHRSARRGRRDRGQCRPHLRVGQRRVVSLCFPSGWQRRTDAICNIELLELACHGPRQCPADPPVQLRPHGRLLGHDRGQDGDHVRTTDLVDAAVHDAAAVPLQSASPVLRPVPFHVPAAPTRSHAVRNVGIVLLPIKPGDNGVLRRSTEAYHASGSAKATRRGPPPTVSAMYCRPSSR